MSARPSSQPAQLCSHVLMIVFRFMDDLSACYKPRGLLDVQSYDPSDLTANILEGRRSCE
jgi:hypothetical protein